MTADPTSTPDLPFPELPRIMTANAERVIENGYVGPRNAAVAPRYSGPATFALLPSITEVPHADIAVVGVPWDAGVSYRSGARFGPQHIRNSSRLLRPYNPAQDYSPFANCQVVDGGDLAINPFNIGEAMEALTEAATQLANNGTSLVTIGGDHTIALPMLRAAAAKHGPVALVHFDAHLDTWDTYYGAEYTHGTPFRRAVEEGIVDTEAICHVGTRGPLYGVRDLEDDRRMGFGIHTTGDVHRMGIDETVARIVERVGNRPVYVSLDIDVLDPAHAPGTGTPEAGGLSSLVLLEVLRGLAPLNIVGTDVVEVLPAHDHAEITGVAAAHVAYEFTTLLARRIGREREAAAGVASA